MTHFLVAFGTCVLVLPLYVPLDAQVSSPFSGPPPVTTAEQTCPAMNTEPSESAARCNVHSLVGDESIGGSHMSFSVSGVGGYDSAFERREGISTAFEGGQFNASALFRSYDRDLLLENAFTAINYDTGQDTRQFLDRTSVSFYKLPSERMAISVDVSNFYGNDTIRLLATAGSDAVETGSYGIHTGMVEVNQATARVSRQVTRSRWWSFSTRNNFRNFIDDNSQANTLHARGEYHFEPSARAGVGIYEETAHETGNVNCTTQGVGLAYERRFSSKLMAEVSAGPAFGTSGCVITLTSNYLASLTAKPRQSTIMYLAAYRKLNDSSFVSATHEDIYMGGMNQRIGLWAWLKLQSGRISGTVPAPVEPFSGYYVMGTFEKSFLAGFSFAISSQHFSWSGISNIAPERNVVLGSLSWSPGRNPNAERYGVITH